LRSIRKKEFLPKRNLSQVKKKEIRNLVRIKIMDPIS